jgi:hypothetical protein
LQLNLPILHLLENSQRVLITGIGGGHDVLGGLPIYFALRELGKEVHLANYSFTDFEIVPHVTRPIVEIPDILIGTRGALRTPLPYFPEGYLTQWFQEAHGEDVPIWMINKLGVQPVRVAFKHLIDKLQIDAIILLDGGVDSLMRGDEQSPGTITEDSITMAALRPLDVPIMIQACIGFGTEVEENLNHYLALQNIASLTKEGAFYGSCSLVPQMPVYQQYESACRFIFDQKGSARSHIHVRIVPSVQGEFGYTQMYDDPRHRPNALITPLMALYWFFDARHVMAKNQLLDMLEDTHLSYEAMQIVMRHMMSKDRKVRRGRDLNL